MSVPSIPIPFAIGESLWHAGYGSVERWQPCPDCAGSRVLTVTRGNGESFEVDCASCSIGFEGPRGVVCRTESARSPHLVTLGSVSVDGSGIRYFEGDYPAGTVLNPDDLFRDKHECQKRCDELNPDANAEEERRIIHNLTHNREKMAWSVHYWGRKIKDLERDLEVARKRLRECKAKVKP